jgi:hypothetical protein
MRSDHFDWASIEFGSAELGDARRTARLVSCAAEAAAMPSGAVSRTCQTSASREGAFRFVENPACSPEAVIAAMTRAAARRCTDGVAIVAVDATAVRVVDETGKKGLGPIGAWEDPKRGVHVMSAFALTNTGAPVGLCSQSYWVRTERSKRPATAHSADIENRESRFWFRALEQTLETFAREAPSTVPWFQLDRGGDCGPLLAHAKDNDLLLTVRATHDRRVDSPHKKLVATLEATKIVATYSVRVTAKKEVRKRRRAGKKLRYWVTRRRERVAHLKVRATRVVLKLGRWKSLRTLEFNAVLVREQGPKEDRIDWLLLSTRAIPTRAEVMEIVRAYGFRWRIEEFHRTWKRGLCRVEDMQLRSREAVVKWATILAAVAARAMRLTYLAREKPDILASTEFTKSELEALIVMREPKGMTTSDVATLTLAQVIRWIAELGSYTGPWNGPPGPVVVARGLRTVLFAVKVLRKAKKMR